MNFPSKIDIGYLIDAAESRIDIETEYFSYRLFDEARKTLEKLKNDQIGPAENTEGLESRIDRRLKRLTKEGIPACPEGYEEMSIIQVLVQFYRRYDEINRIDELRQEDEKHKKYKKWGFFLSPNFQVLEGRTRRNLSREERIPRILTISKALRTALKMLCRAERGDTSEEVFIQENEIPNEFLQDTEYDEDVTYNIIPFDDRPDLLPEVNRAIASLKWGIEATPSPTRGCDVLDCLQKLFGFQESSVSNQRENIVNLLSNEQMRPFIPGEHGTAFEDALENVFLKSLDNYIKWCIYLRIEPIWNNMDDENRKKKRILYVSLYYLIWGEAANVRFLPECLCYIFHHMSKQLDDEYFILVCEQLDVQHVSGSFIDQVIQPLYEVIAAEAKINSKRDVSHSKWRNYDDFNEYFWSPDCLQLGWPLNINSPFFQKPPEGSTTVFGKTSFVERRTFLHLYHSFHRMWIFHVIMFQALAIFAFNDENLNSKTLRKILIVGPTYFLMKLIQSMLDIWLKDGAYCRTSRVDVLRIRFRIICFTSTLIIFFLGMKFLQEKTSPVEESIVFCACIVVLVIYACIIKWINQLEVYVVRRMNEELLDSCLKEEYVGRGMDEKPTDYNKYMVFWIVTLAFNIAYTYCYLIRPLVRPTRDITDVSKNIHNMLAIGSLWAGAICAYIVGSHVSYNVTSAVVGTFVGHKDRLGNIKFLSDVHKCFDKIPTAFMDHSRESPLENDQEDVKKLNAAEFSPFWNKIVMNLREEDYISDMVQIALSMPEKSGYIDVIQWPLFLLVGKVSLAIKIAAKPISQEDMWDEISRDVYMKYAVEECFHSVMFILSSVLNNEGKEWVDGIYDGIKRSIKEDGNLGYEFQLKQLENFVEKISELTGILNNIKDEKRLKNNAKQLLNNVIQHNFLGENKFAGEQIPFSDSDWPTDPELRLQIERLHLLLTMDKSADHVLRNREARRRLKFFTNSLFMSMPKPKPVRKMLSFSVLTPYYEETVIYSLDELESRNDDGVTLIDYLKNLYPDEWTNYCERMKKRDTNKRGTYEYRLWASYRGQTLARTVRGTMYYQKALLLQAYREMLIAEGPGVDDQPSTSSVDALKKTFGSQSLNYKCFDEAKAHVDLKFTYVVSCQIYGKQKSKGKDVAADIAFLLKRNEGLRVAYIDENEEKKEFYSKLVKADKNGKETEVYSIKLPGNPILGEGKPENQNHAIVFTRGNAIQTIDMNQDNYFEETLKMRNLLEEFHREHVIRPATILGIREHIFTGSASSLASFMSNQETGFVTLGQRVIANPLKVRMHYGHPDVFDRVFHITRGGISKASRGINISEDIYAGFNSTLRQGSVTHHEYIQAGKGRDVGFNQIATFEGKVAGGNGEQVLSRDIYRLGLRLDFFRMLSFYYTTVGYYFSSLLMVITLYIILYGNLIMALSGTRVPHVLNDIDMAPEWFLMIVLLPAIYMLLVPYLEQGLEKAVESFLAMFFSLGSIFFAFSLGTRIHWFGRTIIHGGASYQATGRGFVLHHITFSENYRLYSRSHFVKGMEVLFLVVVYIIYGFHSVRAFYNNLLLLGGSILSISWIVAPFLFDSSPFDLNKNSEDQEDWKNWLNRKSDEVEKSKRIEEKVKESWEIWWTRELDHIRTPAGRIIETILSLRFFIFPLVVGYKLDVQGLKNSLSNCVIPWIFLVGILFAHEFFSNKKPEIYFFSYNQLATIGALAIAYYYSAFGDMLAFFIAIITTVWGFLSICVACKPTLKRFSLWTPVKYLARICDTGMGALMFRIANMFSQRSIKQYLVRNMFDQNISELLHNSSTELKMQSTTWVGDPTTRNATSSSISKPPFYRSRDEYINMLPAMYHNFIVDVRDVDRDGNSGFRAVAVGLGRHQNEWKNIRSDLLQELEKHKKGYRKMFPGQYDIVKNRLTFFKDDEFAPEEKWMEMPAIGVLIATHFKVILHIITNSGSQTYLPLYSCPPSWNRLKFISLGHVDNHYVHLLLKKGYPMPHLMEFYRKSKWKRMYLKWIKEGNIS